MNSKKQIIDHISRLEGQLAAVKKEMQQAEPDCVRASRTLRSASRSFAGLRQSFIEAFLMKYFVPKVRREDEAMFDQLLDLIKS